MTDSTFSIPVMHLKYDLFGLLMALIESFTEADDPDAPISCFPKFSLFQSISKSAILASLI